MKVNLDDVSARYDIDPGYFSAEMEKMTEFEDAGLLTREDNTIALTETGRIFMRPVAATFDSWLGKGKGKHSAAV